MGSHTLEFGFCPDLKTGVDKIPTMIWKPRTIARYLECEGSSARGVWVRGFGFAGQRGRCSGCKRLCGRSEAVNFFVVLRFQ